MKVSLFRKKKIQKQKTKLSVSDGRSHCSVKQFSSVCEPSVTSSGRKTQYIHAVLTDRIPVSEELEIHTLTTKFNLRIQEQMSRFSCFSLFKHIQKLL